MRKEKEKRENRKEREEKGERGEVRGESREQRGEKGGEVKTVSFDPLDTRILETNICGNFLVLLVANAMKVNDRRDCAKRL